MKFYRKDWILYQEIANEGGKKPESLIDVNVNNDDPETNKHVPFIEESTDGYIVKMGKNAMHATDAEHHTIFIDICVDEKYYYREYIKLNEEPIAHFNVPKGKSVVAYAFCNLHGMFSWKL